MFPGRAVVALAPRGMLLRLNVAEVADSDYGGFRSAVASDQLSSIIIPDDFTY